MIFNKIHILIFTVFIMVLTACKKPVKNTIDMYSIIPYPQNLEIKDGRFSLNKETKFVISKNLEALKTSSTVFRDFVKKQTGFNLNIDTTLHVKTNYIAVAIDSSMHAEEAYSLSVKNKTIHIAGGSRKGIFNGLQSLRHLLNIDHFKAGQVFNQIDVPNVDIIDAPRYAWRGIMIDESRHFFGKEKIKQLLDLMSLQKLNKFHWHLTDEPGWRIEIKKYPKLTSIGAKGTFSDPDAEAQFYTQEDIKEVIAFASQRNIEVIPEIDMPGHASAAVNAYPELSGGGSEKHPHFTFHPARTSTYLFLTNVLKEVVQLFPSKYIHIGADEVSFGNEQWRTDKEVALLMKKEQLKTLKDVETYFINRIRDSILAMKKEVIGWDEIIEHNMNPEKTVAMWWRHDKPDVLKKGLKNNYKMILCPRKPLYFDFVQDSSHNVGRRWDGFCPIDAIYTFPDSLNINGLNDSKVLGIQANLWTEHIDTKKRFDFMLYPRISALAEAAWTKKNSKSFENFEERLKKMIKVYQQENIYYFDHFSPENTQEPGRILKPNWAKKFSTYKN